MGVHLSSKQVVGTVNPRSFWPGIFVFFYSLKCRGVKNVSKMAIQWQFTIFAPWINLWIIFFALAPRLAY